MIRTKSEDAVSPVIGVMLMLVVTIVIAAVVAVFASGVGMDAEPAPATAVDVTDLQCGTITVMEETEVEFTNSEYINDELEGLLDDADGGVVNYNGLNFKYNDNGYVVLENGEFLFETKQGSWGPRPDATKPREEYLDWLLNYADKEGGGLEEKEISAGTLTLSSLHGDALDLSKISVKISQYFSGGATQPYEYEMPKNSISGTLSPGETLPIVLPNSEKIKQDQVVDLVVYYAGHKIAEEENLKVKRG